MREVKETFFGSPRSSTMGVGAMIWGVYEAIPPELTEYIKQAAVESPGSLRGLIITVIGFYVAAYCRDVKRATKGVKPEKGE